MKITDEALDAASAALGLDLDDNIVAEVYSHEGKVSDWGGHVGELLVTVISAAAPHLIGAKA